jgi:hypothetical protein
VSQQVDPPFSHLTKNQSSSIDRCCNRLTDYNDPEITDQLAEQGVNPDDYPNTLVGLGCEATDADTDW